MYLYLQNTGVPAPLRTSYDKLRPDGVFLLENGIQMFIWVGSSTSPTWLDNVFGVNAPHQLDPVMAELPELDNPVSRRVRDIIATIRAQRKRHVRVCNEELFIHCCKFSKMNRIEVENYKKKKYQLHTFL